ncbi:ADP-ribosylation/Crystallin J1 [Blyttiomyces helicus]|uniref:ADP-ribosylation/Crystallin J1 n=1 Tax=Blyttiomyces helicus TaxID=388810 RepID=A0A4V1IQT0_9FUNG|nr:ADP-ribosylation/Crystallin J1 [Blyttiomyces helicus]|eukprot:RKO87627.1 ADP-ribosylation/Crystallin J1 [Blyttiomyces helicus]
MRSATAAVPHFDSIPIVLSNATALAKVTHADDRYIVSCSITKVVVAQIFCGAISTSSHLEATLRDAWFTYRGQVREPGELARHLYPGADENHPPTARGTLQELALAESRKIGYTHKAIGSALWALRAVMLRVEHGERSRDAVKAVLMEIILEGGDADTNAAIAGALIGCYVGFSGLPEEWRDGLKDGEWLRAKADVLCAMAVGLERDVQMF